MFQMWRFCCWWMHLSRSCRVREIAGQFFPTFISLVSLLFNSRTEQYLENIELWNYIFFAKRCYLILLNSDSTISPISIRKGFEDRNDISCFICKTENWGSNDCSIELRESLRVNNLFAEYSFLSSFLNSCEKASSFQLQDRQWCTWVGHSGWAEGHNTPRTDVACLPAEALLAQIFTWWPTLWCMATRICWFVTHPGWHAG